MFSNEVRSRIGRSWMTIDAHPGCRSKGAIEERPDQPGRGARRKVRRGLAPLRSKLRISPPWAVFGKHGDSAGSVSSRR